MEGFKEEYISLQSATQHCNYSQEYLSLRARQGKLKAVKFGRNWVTKEEWLNEYLSHAEEYNNNGLNGNHATFLTARPPRDLPTETFFAKFKPAPKLNFAVSLALVFVLMTVGITFGKESFKNVLGDVSPLVTEFSGNFDRGIEILTSDISGYDEFAEFTKDTFSAVALSFGKGFSDVALQTADAGKLFVEYGLWASGQFAEMKDTFVNGYVSANEFVEGKIRSIVNNDKSVNDFAGAGFKKIVDVYQSANRFAEEKIEDFVSAYKFANEFVENSLQRVGKSIASPFVKAYNFVTAPWRGVLPEKFVAEEVSNEELRNLQEEVSRLKEEGLVVKETVIEVSKVVQPVTEITREKIVSKLDDASLAVINSQISELQTEMVKRLYAPGGVISQQIYITEPVASPKIYQENGDIVLQTAGSGNVILSAATGMQISGEQVVIDSFSTTNPLVYIADKLNIGGDTEINGSISGGTILLGGAVDAGKIVDVKSGGTTIFSVEGTGVTTLIGNFTITGNLSVSGTQSFTASSTDAALTVTQTGSGETLRLAYDSSNYMTAKVSSDGEVTIDAVGDLAGFFFQDAIYQPVYGTDDGLVLYLPFSEGYYSTTSNSTTTVYDRSPYGNDGTVYSGATGTATTTDQMWADGKYGQALSFDGDDYISIAANSNLMFGVDDFTLEAWINTVSSSDVQMILSNYNAADQVFAMWVHSEGKFKAVYRDAPITETNVASNNAVNDGNWHHVVAQRSGNFIYIYVDGIRQTETGTGVDDANFDINGAWEIGHQKGSSSRYFDGSIDEVRIYNRALSADEIKTHYLRGQTTYGLIQADSFRIIDTENSINFQIDSAGSAAFTASSTSAALTVTQELTGDIVDFQDAGASVFSINDGGYTTLAVDASTTPSFVIKDSTATWTEASSTYLGILATSSFDGRIIDIQQDGTSLFYIDGSGNTVIGGTLSVSTTTSRFTGDLEVEGNILPAITTTYNLGSETYHWQSLYATSVQAVDMDLFVETATSGDIYINSASSTQITAGLTIDLSAATTTISGTTTISDGYLGIATTSPSEQLTVSGNILGSGNIVVQDTAATSSFLGALYSYGTTTLGEATSSPTYLTGWVQSDIIPYSDAIYELGTSTLRWANIYAATGTFGGTITINSTDITSGGALNLTGAAESTWTTNGLTIQSTGDIVATTTENIILTLGDAAGAKKLYITDSSGATSTAALALDSDGNMEIAGSATTSGDLAVLGTFSAATTTTSYEKTVTVAKSGGDYSTIQAAIDAISDSSETNRYLIFVFPGVYSEALTINDKTYIDIVSAGGWETTKVTQASSTVLTISGTSAFSRIQGFEFDVSADTRTGGSVVTISSTALGISLKDLKITWAADTGSAGVGISIAPSLATLALAIDNVKITGAVTAVKKTGGGTTTLTYSDITAAATGIDVDLDSGTINSAYNILRGPTNFDIGAGTTLNSYKDTYNIVVDNGTFNQKDYVRDDAVTALLVSQAGTGNIVQMLSGATPVFTIDSVGTSTFAGNLLPAADITHNLGSASAKWANIYVGTTTIGSTITIGSADITSGGALNLTGASASTWKTTSGDLTIETAGGLTASSTNAFALNVAGTDRLNIDTSGNITLTGPATTTSSLGVQGKVTIDGDLAFTGDQTIEGTGTLTIDPTGALTLQSSTYIDDSGNIIQSAGQRIESEKLQFSGDITINASSSSGVSTVTIQNSDGSQVANLTVEGDIDVQGGKITLATGETIDAETSDKVIITAGGSQVVEIDSTGVKINGVATTTGNFTVEGEMALATTTITGPLSITGSASTTDALTVGGVFTANGNMVFGSDSADTVTLNAYFSSDIIPSSDLAYDLGTSTARWRNLYVGTTTIGGTITIGSADIAGSGALNLTGAAASTWQVSGGALSIQTSEQNLTIKTLTSGDLALTSAGALAETFDADSSYSLIHGATTTLAFDSSGNLTATGTSIALAGDTTITGAATTTSTLGVGGVLTMSGNIVMLDNSITGIDTLTFTDTAGTIAGIENQNLLDKTADEIITGTWGLATTTVTGDFTVNTDDLYIQQSTGNVGIGTTSPSFLLELATTSTNGWFGVSSSTVDAGDIFVIDESGYVGIGTSSPFAILDVYASSTATSTYIFQGGTGAALAVSTQNVNNAFVVQEPRIEANLPIYVNVEGNVGFAYDIEFTDPDLAKIISEGSLAIEAGTPGRYQDLRLKTLGTGNVLVDITNASSSYTDGFKVLGSNGNILTVSEPGQINLRDSSQLVFGRINQKVVKDFEDATATDWVESANGETDVEATTTQARVGDYSLIITTASSSSAADTATTTINSENWSSYERLGFWIRADYTSTSTDATTTDGLISVMFYDSTGSTSSSTVNIAEMGQWQYQEWDISSGFSSGDKDDVDWFGFRIDNDMGSPSFYIDQVRVYDSDLRFAEVFVDSQGNAVLWGQESVEIGRTAASNGSLPSIRAGSAIVEFNQPISVNVGGDVGFDYDIQFTNLGLAQITSAGPLAILAGDPNHAENLTLGTQGTGDVIVDIVNSTTSYGGFKVLGSDSGSYVVRISPLGDVYIGGTGEGGSDLWVKQNITQRGGELLVQPLDITEAEDLSVSDNTATTGSCTSTEAILYSMTASNDNGETTPSATWAASTTEATSSVDISWDPVEGATKYKLYRTNGYRLNDAESAWTAATDTVSVSATATYYKVGSYSAGITVTTTTEPTTLATSTVGTSDLSLQNAVAFWVRSSIDVDRGDLKFVMDETASCLSPDESLSIPALSANTWKYVKLSFEAASTTRDVAACIGISLVTDRGAQEIYIDEVLSSKEDYAFVDGAEISTASSTSYTDDCSATGDTTASPPTQNTTGGKVMVYRGNDYYGSEATSSAFEIDEAVVTIGQPLNVTTGGDVGIAYDLQFLNTGATYITSAGPLWVQAGSPNKTQNLVLTVAGESGKSSGDVIVDVRYSNSTYGGLKVIGSDSGGYVFRVSPSGDVEVGGAGSGGSDLTVKQNITITGGKLTINELSTTSEATLSTTTSGYHVATTSYYRITAGNDNGQTLGSPTSTITTVVDDAVVVSWDAVPGATKYYIWRNAVGADNFGGANDYRIEVAAPSTAYTDTATDTQSTSTYPTLNTTGGGIGITGDIIPATTTATSSSYSLGGADSVWAHIYVVTQHVGDIIFANNLRITEASSSPEALVFQNASDDQIMAIDENGQMTVTKLIATEIETEQLKIRDTTPSETGITIYDSSTDQPYCFKIIDGESTTTAGICQ